MKKILLLTKGNDGVSFHRLVTPYLTLQKNYPDEFKVDLFSFAEEELEEEIKNLSQYDFIVFSRIIHPEFVEYIRKNCKDTRLICDMDDYWQLTTSHPLYKSYIENNIPSQLKFSMTNSDYITTTTELLASKIKGFNTNVSIFPNAVDFKEHKHNETGRIRFGIIGGSSHTKDMELLDGMVNQLSNDVRDKCQFVLCGFDKGVDSNGKQIPYQNTCWFKWELMLTDKYKILSSGYKDFLLQFMNVDYASNEAYRRIWSKGVNSYNSMFDEIDVLLIPLEESEFNACKSPLKLAEAGGKGVAVICSDVEPYKQYLKNEINCLKVNNRKKSKGWAESITKLVKHPELIDKIREGLRETEREYFNLEKITEQRRNWLNSL